jgi:hypothetical protein
LRIPKWVRLGGIDWEIEQTGKLSGSLAGETYPDDCLVLIKASLDPQQKAKTFWHELIHMIFTVRDIPEGKKLDEEEVACVVGGMLFELFRTNAVVRWKEDNLYWDDIDYEEEESEANEEATNKEAEREPARRSKKGTS